MSGFRTTAILLGGLLIALAVVLQGCPSLIANRPPNAEFTANPTSGKAPLTVSFDASASSDPDKDAQDQIVNYEWAFGDSETATGDQVEHTYDSRGAFTAKLTVTDGQGAADTASTQVTASALFGFLNADSDIMRIDTETGEATTVGSTGFASPTTSGMATSRAQIRGPSGTVFSAGTHFALVQDGSGDFVAVINPDTGEGTEVVRTSENINARGIAFGPDGKTLYLIQAGGGKTGKTGRISTIDLQTGAVSEVGNPGFGESNLAFNPKTGMLLSINADGSGSSSLHAIDPEDGSSTLVGTNDLSGVCTLAFAPNGKLFAGDNLNGTKVLVSLDPETGEVVDRIGQLGITGNICGTVFDP